MNTILARMMIGDALVNHLVTSLFWEYAEHALDPLDFEWLEERYEAACEKAESDYRVDSPHYKKWRP